MRQKEGDGIFGGGKRSTAPGPYQLPIHPLKMVDLSMANMLC